MVARQLTLSKNILEKNLGVKVNTVCYPRGSADGRVLKLSRTAGYSLGFVTNSCVGGLLAFSRVGIYAHDSFLRFRLKLLLRRFR
jgi:hypothetical protein